MAGQAVALEAGINHIFYTNTAKLVALVGGDTSRTDLFIDAMMTAKDELLIVYASAEGF
jgi:hypothetical protein